MNLDPGSRRIRDEIDHHLEELETQLRAAGMSPDEARAEAQRRFGDPDRVERSMSEPAPTAGQQLGRAFDGVRQDLLYALRQLRRQPLVSGLTLATVVVGVAATVVVFSVVHAVVLRPLPFFQPDRLVQVSQTSPQGRQYSVSEPNFVDFRARQGSFEEMAALGYETVTIQEDGLAEAVEGMRVSHTFFGLLGIQPVVGRDFLPEEDVFGGPTDVVLLAEGAWRRRWGADPDIVGSTVMLDGRVHQIVGVIPADRAWPGVEVFKPMAPDPTQYRDDQRIESLGRLRPGVTVADAQRDMSRIAAELSDEYPESNDNWGALVNPVRDWLVGDRLARIGGVLLAAVGVFLLMTCASVSNLLLARATSRLGEIGVRTALGAGRRRIVRQLVTEGAVLAAIGGGVALVVAHRALAVVRALGPDDVGRLGQASLDGTVLAVATLSAVVTVLLAGLAPSLLLLRSSVAGALRESGRTGSAPGRRFRDVLVVAQYALAVTVLLGAGLLGRSFIQLQSVDLGFEPSGVLRFAVRLPHGAYDQVAREDFVIRLQDEVQAIPGVVALAATTASPFHRFRPSNFVARSDREPDRQEDFQPVSWRAVTDDYFRAAGIPVLLGRTFGPQDRGEEALSRQNPPVVIDEVLAGALWPDGENPVGRLVTWFLPGGRQCEVIGVVASARDERMETLPRPRIYRPFSFTAWEEPNILVRTTGDLSALVAPVREAVGRVDPAVPTISPQAMEQDVRDFLAWRRFSMQVLVVFGFVALLLAAMGIYGVTAFSVARRRSEIGLRVALGAEPGGVQRMVVGSSLKLALVGIGVGIVASAGLTRFLTTVLYEVSATDPVTYLVVPLALTVVAVASAWVPARRALGIQPRSALTAD